MYVDRFEITLKNNKLITYADRNGFVLAVPGDVDLFSSEYIITVEKSGDTNASCEKVIKVVDGTKLYVSQNRVYLDPGERQKFNCDGLSIEIMRMYQ